MKKLNLKSGSVLDRNELKTVVGGNASEGGDCCLEVTYDNDGYSYWSCSVPEDEAWELFATHYDNLGGSGPATVTGIDCAA